jgi:hypothetical protein
MRLDDVKLCYIDGGNSEKEADFCMILPCGGSFVRFGLLFQFY